MHSLTDDKKMTAQTDFKPQLVLTFLASLATAVMWCGLGFVAKHGYGFPEWLTFLLFAASGVVYCLGALLAHRTLEKLKGRVSPRSVLALALIVQGMVAPLIGIIDGPWVLWFVSFVVSLCSAFVWPIVESYMSSGTTGAGMRSRIGWWNICWMSGTAIGLVGMTPFLQADSARWAIVLLGPASIIAAAMLFWYRAEPMILDQARQEESTIGPNYRPMLSSCRVMMPLSYVLIGAVGPIMPYRLGDLGVSLFWETPLTSIWLFVRVMAVALMWRLSTWHGRWGSLVIGGASMAIGFVLITVGPSTFSVVLGLALLGAGQGITYYSAIYYALALGDGDVESAGKHEALIGAGYGLGPMIALCGLALGGGVAIGWSVIAVTGMASWPAIRPWRTSRKRSTQSR